MRTRRIQAPLLIASIYALVILPLGIILWTRAVDSLPSDSDRLLRLVHDQIQDAYVDEVDEQKLTFGAVRGMVENLDRWGTFVGPEGADAFDRTLLEGTYSGVGVLLVADQPRILAPLPGGPAEIAGLEVGDIFREVGGEPLVEAEIPDPTAWLRERLLGTTGESVEVVVQRGDQVLPFTLRRADVRNPKVSWVHLIDREARLGYVHIRGFQRDVVSEFDAALAQLEADAGGSLAGLVIDLRFNPGGLLDEAVELTNRFVSEGRIVTQKGRDQIVEVHDARPALCTHPDLKLVILINEQTASASELMAAALQDHDRAVIVGSRSYGKGAVQSVFRWEGRDYRLKLTTSLYYPPGGRIIDRYHAADGRGGIVPDLEAPISSERSARIDRGLRQNEVPRSHRERATELGFELPPDPDPASDPQLQAARNALLGR